MPQNKFSQYLLTLTIMSMVAAGPVAALATKDQSDHANKQSAGDEQANDEHSSDSQSSDEQSNDAQAADEHESEEEKLFFPSADSLADLELTLQKALAEDKLALIVFGANWCHDSRALVTRMQDAPLQPVIEHNYETLLIDVSTLAEGRDAIQSLGVPIYYATPTVLIVDPASRQLLNQGNRHMWGSAASISMQDSVEYFQSIATKNQAGHVVVATQSAEEQKLMAEIAAFEQIQAQRLSEAYTITRAMLEGEFDQSVWSEVGKYRNGVAADIDRLREQASSRIKAGESNIELIYPVYPAWSWTADVP